MPLLTGIVAAAAIERATSAAAAGCCPEVAAGEQVAALVVAPEVDGEGDVLSGDRYAMSSTATGPTYSSIATAGRPVGTGATRAGVASLLPVRRASI